MRHSVFACVAALACVSLCGAAEEGSFENPIMPKETIEIFNGKDLSPWYTWLEDSGREDPRGVFSVADGVLKISGDGFGGLVTRKNYANYHLVLEYRWGTVTLRSRKDKSRDSGLLLHCQGPDGGYNGTTAKPGPWMASFECQIIEGGVGDLLVLSQRQPMNDAQFLSACTCEVTRVGNQTVWTPGGEKKRFTNGRINWYGRDPDWKDVAGVRGKQDVESPGQEWTRLECYCDQSTLTYVVNGKVVNRASEVTPNRGKILLQTEGVMYVRKFELSPLPAKRP